MPQAPSSAALITTENSSSLSTFFDKNESLTVGIVLVLFLAICISIQDRYIPWNDEVQFVDPAANLYYHFGFVSREHSNQNDRSFWAGNVPGYSMLLYVAFRTFYFSQTVPRYLNDFIMALAVLFLWIAVRRARILSHPRTRLLMLVFALTGYGCYSCYSNIRYDGLCLLECSLALLAYPITSAAIRNTCFLVLGAGMFLTNLQLPQYAVILLAILLYAYSLGLGPVWRLRFLFIGFAFGGALLYLLYASNPGSLKAFYVTLQQQSGQPLWVKLQDLHYYFEYDLSILAILVFMLGSLAIVHTRPNLAARQSIIAGVLICTVLPLVFFLLRRYVFSSAWMVYIPGVIFVCQALEAKIYASRGWKAFAVICCAASIAAGLPKAMAGMINEWPLRNYAVVESFVTANVNTADVAFCDPAAYFAAKPRVARIYGPGYLDVISSEEKRAITVLIIAPENEAEVARALGGKWVAIRNLVRESRSSNEKLLPLSTNFRCRLEVLRRVPAA